MKSVNKVILCGTVLKYNSGRGVIETRQGEHVQSNYFYLHKDLAPPREGDVILIEGSLRTTHSEKSGYITEVVVSHIESFTGP